MISMYRKYKYRNGEPARILCVDAPGDSPVISLVSDGDTLSHQPDGKFYADKRQSPWDLIEVKEKKTIEFWANIYEGEWMTRWQSKVDADSNATPGRIACKHVVIEYEEGEMDE